MLRYWWLWTLVACLVFGVSTGLTLLSGVLLVSIAFIWVLTAAGILGTLMEKGAKKLNCVGPALGLYVLSWILLKVWAGYAIITIAIVGIAFFIFCEKMEKAQ